LKTNDGDKVILPPSFFTAKPSLPQTLRPTPTTGQARTAGIAGKFRQQHRGTATARTLALQPNKAAIPEKTNDGGNCICRHRFSLFIT